MKDNLINCGERKIQTHSRIALTDICTRYGIQEGDAVEVFIRKTEHKNDYSTKSTSPHSAAAKVRGMG